MYKKVAWSRFKKDIKSYRNNKRVLKELEKIIDMICFKIKLSPKNKDHELKGDFLWIRDCHIFPNVLLVYEIDDEQKTVRFIRIGSHSDLFK